MYMVNLNEVMKTVRFNWGCCAVVVRDKIKQKTELNQT